MFSMQIQYRDQRENVFGYILIEQNVLHVLLNVVTKNIYNNLKNYRNIFKIYRIKIYTHIFNIHN